MKGRIDRMNLLKGFGWVVGEDGVSRFFHANDQDSKAGCPPFAQLREQLPVSFEVVPDSEAPRGPRGRRLVPIKL